VRIATPLGWTAWSPTQRIETGLNHPDDWTAVAVGIDSTPAGPAPMLRKEFDLRAAPSSARLYITSLGLNESYINGRKVSGDLLSPGWTPYGKRLLVSTHDVTSLLREGSNVIGAILGDGWFRGRLGWDDSLHYGDELGLIAQLEITYPDGTTDLIVTDESWNGGFGHVRASGLYDGSDIDLGLSSRGWAEGGFDGASWARVHEIRLDKQILSPAIAPPVREVQRFDMHPVGGDDHVVLDSGQNLAGWVGLRVRGKAGNRVKVRHSEILQPDGSLFTQPLRTARATDTYVLDQDGEAVLEPVFTFHGFRFAEFSGDAQLVSAEAVAVSSDNASRGTFSASEPALDRLHSNAVWSQRSNFVSLPTDCPQRDERFGWTGDAQAFAATANTLFDAAEFWQSWLYDLGLEQGEDGAVPSIVPNVLGPESIMIEGAAVNVMGRAGWGDAATIVPWSVYQCFGDPAVLRHQLSSMRRWVEYLRSRCTSDGLLPTEFQWGDWLDPDAPEPWNAKVSSDFVANAFFVHSTRILARTEDLVGDPARASELHELADQVARLVWDLHGKRAIESPSGCAIALRFSIVPECERSGVAAGLAGLVRENRGRIGTGFLGTPLVLHALSESGHLNEAFELLLCREVPSWLYQVDAGATTYWERWDAVELDGRTVILADEDNPNSPDLLSFNHYAYGSVVDWLYRGVAGLSPTDEAPGYRDVVVSPHPAVGVTWARAAIDSAYGSVAIDWRMEASSLIVDLTLPFGSRGRLDLPLGDISTITIDGEPSGQGTIVTHGTHHIVVTDAAVAGV